MIRSPGQAVKFKRQALGWNIAKLAEESGHNVEEIRDLENGRSSDEQLLSEVGALLDREIAKVLPLWEKVISDPDLMSDPGSGRATRKLKLLEFGKLLKDRRHNARFSRLKLAKLAGLSDATIKFIETARNPPSRRTCQALISVKELGLKWADVAILDYVGPEPSELVPAPEVLDQDDSPSELVPAQEVPDQDDSPSELVPASEIPDQDFSAASDRACESGEIIEEEITTHIRRTIRRK